MRKQHNQPRNDRDFEELCLKLLRAYWKCPELQLYAIRGQSQHGVDIVDLSGQEPLRAAQCKLHEEGKVTTRSEVKSEIEKAKTFQPPLNQYVIMTTGKVKKDIHDLLIKVNREHREKNLFIVEVFDWSRLEELLEEHTEVRNWYEGGLSTSPSVRIETKIDKLLEISERSSEDVHNNDIQDKYHAEIDEARHYLEKHEYQIGKLLLQRAKLRNWDKMNARHRFRLLTNLAVIEMSSDELKKAAELLFEAKRYQPAEEVALTNEALGYWMLGQNEHAFELAGKLREKFPRSGSVLGIFIQSAPESMVLESIVASVPQDLLQEDDVAVALAQRALDSGEVKKAENFIRAATSAESRNFRPWLLLGHIIIQSEVLQSFQRHGNQAWFCNEDRLREAEAVLNHALKMSTGENHTSASVEALLNRCQTRFILDKNSEARSDLEELRRIAPSNPKVIETYGNSLMLEGKLNDAIEVMWRVPQEKLSDHGRLMLGMMLMERGDQGDYRRAADLFSQVAKSPAKFPDGYREHAIDIGILAFTNQEQFNAGHKLLADVPDGTISDVAFKTLMARLHLLEGDQNEALKYADEALDSISDKAIVSDVRRLALLLFDLQRFTDALFLWQRIALPGVLSPDTRCLLECANRLNRHEIMLDTFRGLRKAGAIDRELLDSELSMFEMYDTDAAIRILDEEISLRPEDTGLKLRRSILGLALDRPELVDQDPLNVPKAGEVEPQTALNAVRVLKAIGHEQYAVEYAYSVIRKNFQDADAHRAFILALAPFPSEPKLEKPECVKPGTTVCYVEQGYTVAHWIIVEDEPNPDSQFAEPELSPDNNLCKAIMGLKVGDTFTLAKGIQDRIGEITQIQSKYVYRFQDCTDQWQVRFPELPYLQAVNISQKTHKSGEPELDISVILKSVDERHEHVSESHETYKKKPLTLHLLGLQFNVSAFEALRHLALSEDVPIRCCSGSGEERENAEKALRTCNTVILDLSAISTLFLLDRLDALEFPTVNLVVSRNTVNTLRQMIANESWFYGGKSGVMLKTETGHSFVETTEKQHEAHIKSLRHLVEKLEANCKVESCDSLAAMNPEKRATLIKGFGLYGAEAILLSAVPGTVLWTDDHVQAVLAKTEHGVSRVWTQLFIGSCIELGVLDPSAYLDASAKLLGYQYYFTSENPAIIRQAGIIADWRVDSWPLSPVLSFFAEESVDLMQMLQVAAGFFRLLYQEPVLLQTKVIITVKILENLARRKGGIQGIHSLYKSLPQIFGLNLVGLEEATKTIEAWLTKSIENRPFSV